MVLFALVLSLTFEMPDAERLAVSAVSLDVSIGTNKAIGGALMTCAWSKLSRYMNSRCLMRTERMVGYVNGDSFLRDNGTTLRNKGKRQVS